MFITAVQLSFVWNIRTKNIHICKSKPLKHLLVIQFISETWFTCLCSTPKVNESRPYVPTRDIFLWNKYSKHHCRPQHYKIIISPPRMNKWFAQYDSWPWKKKNYLDFHEAILGFLRDNQWSNGLIINRNSTYSLFSKAFLYMRNLNKVDSFDENCWNNQLRLKRHRAKISIDGIFALSTELFKNSFDQV